MKKQLQIRTAGGTRMTNDTVEAVKRQPDAKEISVFNENTQTYIPECRKIDGVWITEGSKPFLS